MNDDTKARMEAAIAKIQAGIEEANEVYDSVTFDFQTSAPHSWVVTVDQRGLTTGGSIDSNVYSITPEGMPDWMSAALSAHGAAILAVNVDLMMDDDDD